MCIYLQHRVQVLCLTRGRVERCPEHHEPRRHPVVGRLLLALLSRLLLSIAAVRASPLAAARHLLLLAVHRLNGSLQG